MSAPRMSLRLWLQIAVVFLTFAATTHAADRLAGDLITLRNGSRLRGVLFEQSDKSITLLVSAKWLSTANAKLLQPAKQQNIETHMAGLEQALRRLKTVRPPAGNGALEAFLRQQADDVEAELAKAEGFQPEFLWLTLPKNDVARVEVSTLEHRQLLAWAWVEEVDRAESRWAEELSRDLKARNVSPVGWPFPFIERLPAREQSDDEWAARLALTEYALGKPLDFQGTGDVLARAGREIQQADVAQLLAELLRGQLQSQLGDLLNEGKPTKKSADNAARADSLKKVIQIAESEKRLGFRATRLDLAGDIQQATVTTQFVARLADGSWRTVFQYSERADAAKTRPEIEKRIQDDPQVKQVLELTRQIGLTAEAQIQQAIRFGAATMTAQQACDSQFASFRDVYRLSFVRPPLSVPRGN